MLFQFCHSVDHDCEESDDESSGNESSGDILFGSGFGSGSESKCEEGCDCPGQKLYNGTHCVPYQECSCVKPGTNEIVPVSIDLLFVYNILQPYPKVFLFQSR